MSYINLNHLIYQYNKSLYHYHERKGCYFMQSPACNLSGSRVFINF